MFNTAWSRLVPFPDSFRHRLIVLSLVELVGLVGLFVPATLLAQPVPTRDPSSTHIYPAGGRRGTVVPVRVGAECIPPETHFYLSGRGVEAPGVLGDQLPRSGEPSPRRKPTEIPITYPRQWQSEIRIDAEASLGPIFWRLGCAHGGTGARPFLIGDLPEHLETESNSAVDGAEVVALPVTLNGQIDGERDVDYFRFSAQAGEVIACEVFAQRLGSRLDPIVELLDSSGRPVAVQRTHAGSDPLLAHRAVASGEFLLRVSNVSFRGDPAHVYRIHLRTSPLVAFAFPPGGQVGTEAEIDLFALTGTGEWHRIRKQIRFPDRAEHGSWSYLENGLNPVQLAVGEFPSAVEREPNEHAGDAAAVSLPIVVYGQLATPTDVDWLTFRAEQGQAISIRCQAFPPGTAALPTLQLVGANGQALDQKKSIDQPDGVCRIEFRAAESADYRLRVRDLRHGAQGGPDFLYRLSAEPARPDFEVALNRDFVDVLQGETTELDVSVIRNGGFDGEVELVAEGLPAGISVENRIVPVGAGSAKLKLVADAESVATSSPFRLSGRASILGESVVRTARARHLGSDQEGVSVGSPVLEDLQLTVRHKPVFRLECSEAYLYAHRGSVFPYPMQIERLNGFDGEITLQIGDRQNRDLDFIEMFETRIPPGQTQAIMPIYLPEVMHINVQSQSQLYTQGHASFVDKHGRQQSVLVVSEKRNMLRTLPPVVKLNAVEERIHVQAERNVVCRFRLDRTSHFPGAMQLELVDQPPNGYFVAESQPIPAGATEAHFVLTIRERKEGSAGIPAGQEFPLRFRATGRMQDRFQIITEAVVTVVVP